MTAAWVLALATVLWAQTPAPVLLPYHVNVPLIFDQPVAFTSTVTGAGAGGGGVGPAGPPGPMGPPGPQGVPGPAGSGGGASIYAMVGSGATGAATAYKAANTTIQPVDPTNLSRSITVPKGRALYCLLTANASNDATGDVLVGIMDGQTILNHAHLKAAGGAVAVQAQVQGDDAAHVLAVGAAATPSGNWVVWNGQFMGGLYPMLRCDLQ